MWSNTVNAGFSYESIHIEGGKQAHYPKTLKEAKEFVRSYGDRINQPAPGYRIDSRNSLAIRMLSAAEALSL